MCDWPGWIESRDWLGFFRDQGMFPGLWWRKDRWICLIECGPEVPESKRLISQFYGSSPDHYSAACANAWTSYQNELGEHGGNAMGWNKRQDLSGGWSIWDRGGLKEGVRLEHEEGTIIELPPQIIMEYAWPVFAKAVAYRAVCDLAEPTGQILPTWGNFNIDIEL